MPLPMLIWATFGLGAAARAAWEPPPADVPAYNAAVAQMEAGQLREAEAALRALVAAAPDAGAALDALGLVKLRQGALSDARDLLERAAATAPGRPEPHVHLSILRFAAQDFTGAAAAAEEAVARAPADPAAVEVRVLAALRLGQVGQAHAAVAAGSAAGLATADAACLRVPIEAEAGRPDAAEQALQACRAGGARGLADHASAALGELRTRGAAEQAQAALDAARRALQAGDLPGAIAQADAALALRPRRPDALLLRGRARHAAGQLPGARADLEAGVSADPWVELSAQGGLAGVLRASDARVLDREQARGSALLVEVLIGLGDLGAARGRLDAARARWPAAPSLLGADALLRAATGDRAGAWAGIDAALVAHPADADLLAAAAALARQDPGGAPPRVASRLAVSGDWGPRATWAQAELKAGRPATCLDTAREILSTQGLRPADRQAVGALAHRCAVAAQDLAAADALLPDAGGPGALPASTAFNHALLRQAAGDPRGAQALIDGKPVDDHQKGAYDALRFQLHLSQGQLDPALALAPRLAPADALPLVQPLIDAGRPAEALPLLRRGCPALSDARRETCEAVLAQISGG